MPSFDQKRRDCSDRLIGWMRIDFELSNWDWECMMRFSAKEIYNGIAYADIYLARLKRRAITLGEW